MDRFLYRPSLTPAAGILGGEGTEPEFKCRTKTGAWRERARPLILRGGKMEPTAGQRGSFRAFSLILGSSALDVGDFSLLMAGWMPK